MIYQGARAEVRRLHSGARWYLGGIVLGGTWYQAAGGIRPASDRAIEAGNVDLVRLPSFEAADDGEALAEAAGLALARGYEIHPGGRTDPTRGYPVEAHIGFGIR